MIRLDDMLMSGWQELQAVTYAGPHLGGEAPLVRYVLGAGVAMALGLSQCQRDNFSHFRLMIVHGTPQVGHGVSCVRVVDEVIGVVSVVWWRRCAYRCG